MKKRTLFIYLMLCLEAATAADTQTPTLNEETENERMGHSVIAGDFNGDSLIDVAIGAPDYQNRTGRVKIEYGHGLTEFWTQGGNGQQDIAGGRETSDIFGQSLAVGDFNSDGYDDLAVGAPGEDLGTIISAGMVNIIYGSATGLTGQNNHVLHQNKYAIVGAAEQGDMFGSSLTIGDFNGDGFDDLAIGVPGEDLGNIISAGMVNIVYGSATGLTNQDNQVFHQNRGSIVGSSESDDMFGWSLTSGDFNGDGIDDLAVGVPKEDIDTIQRAGMVNIIYGSTSGLTDNLNQVFYQDKGSIKGKSEVNDQFGFSLTSGDFNKDGFADLAVGAYGEKVANIAFAGMVNIIYGSASGLTDGGNQAFHQNTGAIKDASETNDQFGYSLTSGDINGDGIDDLAIGVPTDAVDGKSDAGMVNIIYGSHDGLSDNNNFVIKENVDNQGSVGVRHQFGFSLTSADINRDGASDILIGSPGNTNKGTVTQFRIRVVIL